MKDSLTTQVAQLSAGTIARLSNLRTYEDIDTLRESLRRDTEQWVRLGVLTETDTWQHAWNLYKFTHDVHLTL